MSTKILEAQLFQKEIVRISLVLYTQLLEI